MATADEIRGLSTFSSSHGEFECMFDKTVNAAAAKGRKYEREKTELKSMCKFNI